MKAVAESNGDIRILEHLPLVKLIAVHIHENLPVHVELDDLISSGLLGLFDALSRFKPDRNVDFPNFAKYRIRGAIFDALRQNDWLSRHARQFQKRCEKARAELIHELQRMPTEEEIARRLKLSLEKFRERESHVLPTILSLSRRPSYDDELPDFDAPCPEGIHPDRMLEAKEVGELIKNAGEAIPPNYWLVILWYYWEDKTMKEIGEFLGVSESRVSQIHDAALNKLSAVLYRMGIVSKSQLVD